MLPRPCFPYFPAKIGRLTRSYLSLSADVEIKLSIATCTEHTYSKCSQGSRGMVGGDQGEEK